MLWVGRRTSTGKADGRKKVGPEEERNWLGVIGGKNRLFGDRRPWEVKEGKKVGELGLLPQHAFLHQGSEKDSLGLNQAAISASLPLSSGMSSRADGDGSSVLWPQKCPQFPHITCAMR